MIKGKKVITQNIVHFCTKSLRHVWNCSHDIKKTLNFMKEENFKPQATNNNKIKNPSY